MPSAKMSQRHMCKAENVPWIFKSSHLHIPSVKRIMKKIICFYYLVSEGTGVPTHFPTFRWCHYLCAGLQHVWNETKEKAEMGDERRNLNKIILLIINTTFDASINFWSLWTKSVIKVGNLAFCSFDEQMSRHYLQRAHMMLYLRILHE